MERADPVQRYGGHGHAAALGLGHPLPAFARPARGGAKAAVEVARAVDRPDDRVEGDRLEPHVVLAAAPERPEHVVEREDDVHVARLAA